MRLAFDIELSINLRDPAIYLRAGRFGFHAYRFERAGRGWEFERHVHQFGFTISAPRWTIIADVERPQQPVEGLTD